MTVSTKPSPTAVGDASCVSVWSRVTLGLWLALFWSLTVVDSVHAESVEPDGESAFERLVERIDRVARREGVLEARLELERSIVEAVTPNGTTTPSSSVERGIARASIRLRRSSAAVAGLLEPRLAARPSYEQLLESAIEALAQRDIRVMHGGNNALLTEALADLRPHPGSRGLGLGAAYWVDCDLLAAALYGVMAELDRRSGTSVVDTLAAVVTSDHLALAIRAATESRAAVVDLFRDGEVVRVRLVPFESYSGIYRRRDGESPRLLDLRLALMVNGWEVAAARLLQGGQVALAERYARRALALDPRSPAAWNTLALAEREQGKVDRALSSLSRAIELRGSDPRLFSNLASLYLLDGQLEHARRAAESAVLHGPEEALARQVRGNVLLNLGEMEAANRDEHVYRALLASGEGIEEAVASAPE